VSHEQATVLEGESVTYGPVSGGHDKMQSDTDQYQLATQALVLAVRSAVTQLRNLEDQAVQEKEADDHPAQKEQPRISKLFEGLSTMARSPSPQPTPVTRRASTWLDKLVFDEQPPTDPHPGERHDRFSSATTADIPFVLLQKWTETRPRRSCSTNKDEPRPVFSEPSFVNAANELSKSDRPHPQVSRVATFGISPKSTLALQPPRNPIVTAINLPQTIEAVEEDWVNLTYERWMSLALYDLGVRFEPDTYELAVMYGGHERVILPTDKPSCIFEDLSRYGLRPRLFLRKTAQSRMTHVDHALLADEPLTSSPVRTSFSVLPGS